MKRKTRFWIVLIGILLAVSVAAMVIQFALRETGTAQIWLEGELLRTIDLTAVEESFTFTVTGEHGSNRIEVENGRICVIQADCPDQVCVRQGWIADSSTPIVCLPNGLVIEIIGKDAGLDAVLQ